MKMKKMMLSVACAFALVACSGPLDQKIPTDSAQWKQDADFLAAIKKLPEDQRALLQSYMMRTVMASAFGKAPDAAMIPVTIGDAIKQEKETQAQEAIKKAEEEAERARQEALAKEAEAKRQAELEKARKALTVAVTSLDYIKADYRRGTYTDSFSIRIALQNNTGKDMQGVKGSVVFADMFGDVIKRVGLSVDDGIPSGKQLLWSGNLGYNQFMLSLIHI